MLTEMPPGKRAANFFGRSTLIEFYRGGVPQPLLSNYYCLTLYTTSSFRGIASYNARSEQVYYFVIIVSHNPFRLSTDCIGVPGANCLYFANKNNLKPYFTESEFACSVIINYC